MAKSSASHYSRFRDLVVKSSVAPEYATGCGKKRERERKTTNTNAQAFSLQIFQKNTISMNYI